MRLLIDLDGVCADFYSRLIEWYNRDYDDNLTLDDLKSWQIDSSIFGKATREDIRLTYFNMMEFWTGLDPIPGAKETLKHLQERGHELVIVTAIPRDGRIAFQGKSAWVDEHLPFIGFHNFIAATKKQFIDGDIIFDDGPHNIAWFPKTTVAMDAPYNQNVFPDFRVKSWAEFESIVKELECA